MSRHNVRLALVCVTAALALGVRRLEAFCDGGDPVACFKAKAIVTLDRVSRADELRLAGSAVTLVRRRRRRRDDDDDDVVDERSLRSRPDDELDAMLYDKTVGLFSGRTLRIGFPEMTPDQLKTAIEEGKLFPRPTSVTDINASNLPMV